MVVVISCREEVQGRSLKTVALLHQKQQKQVDSTAEVPYELDKPHWPLQKPHPGKRHLAWWAGGIQPPPSESDSPGHKLSSHVPIVPSQLKVSPVEVVSGDRGALTNSDFKISSFWQPCQSLYHGLWHSSSMQSENAPNFVFIQNEITVNKTIPNHHHQGHHPVHGSPEAFYFLPQAGRIAPLQMLNLLWQSSAPEEEALLLQPWPLQPARHSKLPH